MAASEREPRTAILAHVRILCMLCTYLRHVNACVRGAGVQSDLDLLYLTLPRKALSSGRSSDVEACVCQLDNDADETIRCSMQMHVWLL